MDGQSILGLFFHAVCSCIIPIHEQSTNGQKFNVITFHTVKHNYICMHHSHPSIDNPWMVRVFLDYFSTLIRVCIHAAFPSIHGQYVDDQRYNVFTFPPCSVCIHVHVYMHASFPSIHGQSMDGQRYNVVLDYFSTLFHVYMYAEFPSIPMDSTWMVK